MSCLRSPQSRRPGAASGMSLWELRFVSRSCRLMGFLQAVLCFSHPLCFDTCGSSLFILTDN